MRYNLQLPINEPDSLDQDEAFFYLTQNGGERIKVRFHDYDKIYTYPGLYEQIFYQRLKCISPLKITSVLKKAVDDNKEEFSEIRVLDVGAGNGIVGEELNKLGVARIVGVDILDEAKEAVLRDRAGVYDEYYVMDLTKIDPKQQQILESWQFNCMTCVAALGFGDIPVEAFTNAFNLVKPSGWIAFNIKETFFDKTDVSGFSVLIKEMFLEQIIDVHHIERYRHRISIDGKPLYYFVIVGRKLKDA